MDSDREVGEGSVLVQLGTSDIQDFLGYDGFQNIDRIHISNGFQYLENISKRPVIHKGKINL